MKVEIKDTNVWVRLTCVAVSGRAGIVGVSECPALSPPSIPRLR